MKRNRSDYDESIKHFDIAESLMMLSKSLVIKKTDVSHSTRSKTNCNFECKTCNKKFSSFQALGGHRASHKKPKLTVDQENVKQCIKNEKDMHHECSMCGQTFGTGQALGGHMRKHRTSMKAGQFVHVTPMLHLDLNLTPLENDILVYL